MNHTLHRALQILAAAVLVLLIVSLAAVLVVQSGWFRERVRARIVEELERATGAHAEVANFNFDWKKLSATVAPVILHGKESETEDPLARVNSITVGLRLISALERRVDLALLRVDKPMVHIIIYPDGSTNLPLPRQAAGGKDWSQSLVDLAVQQYEIRDGALDIDGRKTPLNVRGEDLDLSMTYNRGAPGILPYYQGQLASRHVQLTSGESLQFDAALSANFRLDGRQAQFSRLRLAAGASRVDLSGTLTNLRAPRGKFAVKAALAVPDLIRWTSVPLKSTGQAAFDGNLDVSFGDRFDYALDGRVNAKNLSYTKDRLSISGASLAGVLHATPQLMTLRNLSGDALNAKFTGEVSLADNKRLHAEGNFENASLREIARVATDRPVPWEGIASGVFTLDTTLGANDSTVRVSSSINPPAVSPETGSPVSGQVDVRWDQSSGTITFGQSRIATPATTVDISGTLGQVLNVRAHTTNLDDVLPAISMIDPNAPPSLPLKLNSGEATVEGTVTGPLDDAQFRGQVAVTHGVVAGHSWDQFTGTAQASRRAIVLQQANLKRGATQVSGDVTLTAVNDSFDDGSITGRLSATNIQLAEVVREFGSSALAQAALTGSAAGGVRLAGTVRHPEAEIVLDANKITAYGQTIDRLQADARYSPLKLDVTQSTADIGMGKLQFNGSYSHPENVWIEGDVQGDVTVTNVPAQVIAMLRQSQPDTDAVLNGKTHIEGRVEQNTFALRSLNGTASARAIVFRKEPLGDLSLTARSQSNRISIDATGKLRDSTLTAQGEWQINASTIPGKATVRFSRTSVAMLHGLMTLASPADAAPPAPPFEGFLEGGATVNLDLRKPSDFQAEVKIDSLEFRAKPSQALRLDVSAQDIQLKNREPIILTASSKEIRIRDARLSARDTDLEATGVLPFTATGGADFNVKGNVNLAILQLLNPDLLAKGNASVTAAIRGSLRSPSLNGRMELTNASLYLSDVPTGVDRANGVILFDRNRATIERLSAETGGGQIDIKGSLDFGEILVYRLQADARGVRVRYPQDVSLTATAQLSLTGASDNSTLTGTLQLNRAAITQGADLGRVLAAASTPSTSPANPNEYLRGMHLDVHVENASTFQLETSLTRNIQIEVDLRVRGTLLAPTVLGTVSASSGEIQMFGNRYTVNRGDVRFLNPVKIEPLLDLALETRARGILVNVTISGSPQKLNVNYSSDPPLQSREIIALLAVGRDPTALSQNSQIAASASTTGFGDAGGLLGEAVSEQLSNRIQRFFGSSRVKIDPTVTGVDTLPSARLTLEQQVSRDVTLTYTTNLNRAQEQIVRLQWDLNQQWSAVAVRDANGLFGVDVQFRKRFK